MTVQKLVFDKCRLYYNSGVDPTKAWSIDAGEGTPELLVPQVMLSGLTGATKLSVRLTESGAVPLQPHAWIEFNVVSVTISTEFAAIEPFTSFNI